MCDNPKVALLLKSEYDVSFLLTGRRSKPKFVGRLSDYAKDIAVGDSYNPTYYDISSHFPPEYNVIFIPCRKCFSCRLDHSRRRAGQGYCEFKTSKKSCFLTLTFGDVSTYNYFRNRKYNKLSPYLAKRHRDFLTWSLDSDSFKGFMKRLRDHIRQVDMRKFCLRYDWLHSCIFKCDKSGRIMYDVPLVRVKFVSAFAKDFIMRNCEFRKIRFLHSAEYGSKKGRPHHHCILYGVDFNEYSDVYSHEVYHSGKKQVNLHSKTLDNLWQFGDVTIGKCTSNSINYVTRYCMKKVLGENKDVYYSGRKSEYITCSTKPALGHDYLIQNFNDICSNRNILMLSNKGKVIKVPICRYFSDYIKKVSTEHNNGVAYGSYSDILSQRAFDDNLNKYNKILNTGFFNWSSSKKEKSDNIVKQLVRSYDDSNVVDISLLRKLKAFGVSYEYYSKHKSAIDFVFSTLSISYKNFEPYVRVGTKYQHAQFERYRCKLLEDLRLKYIDKCSGVPLSDELYIFDKFYRNYFPNLLLSYDFSSYQRLRKVIISVKNPFSGLKGKKVLGSAFVKNYINDMVRMVS